MEDHIPWLLEGLPWVQYCTRLDRLHKTASWPAPVVKCHNDATTMPVWMAWKEWDFGQKRIPSPWLTLLAQRVILRMGMDPI